MTEQHTSSAAPATDPTSRKQREFTRYFARTTEKL
jgi:hypothetical protein